MNNLLEDLKAYYRTTPQNKIDEDWAKYANFDDIGPKVNELLTHFDTHFSYEDNLELEDQIKTNNIKSDSPKVSGFFFVN